MKYVANAMFDGEVAELLGFSRTKFATLKCRGQLPKTEIELWATKNGVSLNWLLTGEGEPSLFSNTITPPARDTQTQQMLYAATTEHLPSTIHWPVIILNSTQIHYSLEKARVVLESQMHLSSNALALNIDRFYEQVTQGEEKRGLPPPAKSPSESPPSTGIIPAEEPPETEELRHKFKALIGGRGGFDVGV